MYISPAQARGARALLNLNISEIVDKTSISSNPLAQFMRGDGGLSDKKIAELKRFFINNGLEFLPRDGVQRQPDSERRYTGASGFKDFMDDVYTTARDLGGDICLYNSKPTLWPEILGEEWYSMHAQRMAELGDKINVRIILHEDQKDTVLDIANHKWTGGVQWNGLVSYIYGNKFGLLDFKQDGDIEITVINSPKVVDNQKAMFNEIWKTI